MYIPPAFEITDEKIIQNFIKTYPFATLISPHSADITHLPLLMRDKETLEGHFAINNPHCLSLEKQESVIAIFHGNHAYITPAWYENRSRAVPTWNYAVVHIHGKISRMSTEEQLKNHVSDLVKEFESHQNNAWHLSEASQEFIGNLLKAIKGFTIKIEKIEAKFKLGQNRSDSDKRGMIKGLKESPNPIDRELGIFMESHLQ